MRSILKVIAGVAVVLVWGLAAIQFFVPEGMEGIVSSMAGRMGGTVEIQDERIPLAGPSENGYTTNGWLRVQEGRLVNEAGEPFQLRGMSSHGVAWFPEYTGIESIATTKNYGANLFRIAMYVDDTPGNYTADADDRQTNVSVVTAAIDAALSLDMYAIADWHIMEDGNPLSRVDDAVQFFDTLSTKYADSPGVLYEICNEPNGDTTWADIQSYANRVIPVIRANAPEAVILVGTPDFSTDLASPAQAPLPQENILYSYHYYTNAAPDKYLTALDAARAAGIPVFVTEWGVGDGSPSASKEALQRAIDFLAYLQAHDISWANWSLCNKDESYSAIRPDVSAVSGWTQEQLSAGGLIVFGAMSR